MTREEAIEMLKYNSNVIHQTIDGRTDPKEIEALDMAIKALEQEPKTGHWIYSRRRDWDGECAYECSECGMGSDVEYSYCMRCGARMICEPQEDKEDKEKEE